ncbi:MAG: cation-translocating P-type ATPase [Chloroflexi bacterium]|nr:cation-translocating P-type ATPase [Chloroflexota bacterium]
MTTLTLPITGMDCAECTEHVRHAIAALPGVESVNVFLASEKATVRLDPALVELPAIRKAVEGAGYSIKDEGGRMKTEKPSSFILSPSYFSRRILTLFAVVFGAVLFVVVAGEWLGLFEKLTERVPFVVGLALVVAGGWPIFRNVARAAWNRQVTSHTLMTLGVLAALAVGQWATAAVVVFFMRVGDTVENFTTERARRAVKDLTALAPQTARVERDGEEREIQIGALTIGETVIVRPGEEIPADGVVIAGQATVDQATITGESMPVEAGVGAKVFAATIARLGSLRVRVTQVGADTTFGRVVRLVEEAEAHRAAVQRFADKFTGYYLPIVAGIAALTFLIRRDPLATAAVLVVACSCSVALATPIAMLASIGAAAKRGLLIKGGKYLETLARADVVLIDKTGTVTLGKPQVTEVMTSQGLGVRDWGDQSAISNQQSAILQLAASAERYSEHPLAEAVRAAARERSLPLDEPREFEATPGIGIRARVNGELIAVGNRRSLAADNGARHYTRYAALEAQGKTLLFVTRDGELTGVIAAADTLRPEVPTALAELRALGVRQIELLTGDNEQTAANLARQIGVAYRSNLMPEDKIGVVKDYQAKGHVVVMVGDGVNDAPALAQADVGIAMGAAGTDIAIEAAHVALMRDDWRLVPEVFRIARRTMGVVKMNLVFTAVYNVAGLSLAALGLIPPIFAAAAQSLPDLGILANSSRLLRQK